jgi:anionic cell wall polymer biosynthesis LytR-Cps2A-Psr (LCP) family protein
VRRCEGEELRHQPAQRDIHHQGTQALAFVRQRYGLPNGVGDLDRIQRQQYFLSAVFRKLSSAGVLLNPFKLQDLLKAVSTSLTMDQSLDPLKLAEQMQNLTAGNLSITTIPTDGFADEDVGNVVVVHPAQVQARLKALIGKSGASAPTTAAPHTTAPTPHSTPPSSASTSGVTTAQQAGKGCIY